MKSLMNISWIWFTAIVLFLAAAEPAVQSAYAGAAPAPAAPSVDYHLGSGDKLRVIVFGEDELGGEYTVDGGGYVRLPLIGQIHATGDTVHQFETEVADKLRDGYLKDPRVSVEVTNYRPFYILGEVNKPGEYAFVNGMSVLNAVALAGGYTFRANQGQVYVRRDGSAQEVALRADQTTKIYPGDIIRIGERLF